LETLFSLISEYGETFSDDFWTMILQGILKSLFSEIKLSFLKQNTRNEDENKMRDIVQKCFNYFSALICQFYNEYELILEEGYEIFHDYITTKSEVKKKNPEYINLFFF
jgi:hypothetical protein